MDRGRTLSVADAELGAIVRSARNEASEGGRDTDARARTRFGGPRHPNTALVMDRYGALWGGRDRVWVWV